MIDRDAASYASLGRRMAAFLLDSLLLWGLLILAGLTLPVAWALGVPHANPPGASPEETWHLLGVGAKLLVLSTFLVSLGALYYTLYEASARQATFGKQILNIYVAGDDGARISFGRALGRWTVGYLANWTAVGFLSVITILATKARKSLPDLASNTVVLRGRPEPGGAVEFWRLAVALVVPFVWTLGTFLITL